MADEVETETDPLTLLAQNHVSRMQEIADAGFDKTKEICGDMVTRLKKHSGLRDAIVDKTLEAFGIKGKEPVE